jgi:hypothetical protein
VSSAEPTQPLEYLQAAEKLKQQGNLLIKFVEFLPFFHLIVPFKTHEILIVKMKIPVL